jgi:phosphocarrier protein HPr
MPQCEVEIVNELGLNASACAKLTAIAAKYQCDVAITRKGRRVNAKSFMGVMMLAAGRGSRVMLETDGPDETEALDAIVALIANGFDEQGANSDSSSAI